MSGFTNFNTCNLYLYYLCVMGYLTFFRVWIHSVLFTSTYSQLFVSQCVFVIFELTYECLCHIFNYD